MSWKTTFDGSFGLFNAQEVQNLPVMAGGGVPGVALPVPSGEMMDKTLPRNPAQTMVTAHEDNPGTVIIGKRDSVTGLFSAGLRLLPGAAQVLPDPLYSVWYMAATQAGCKVTVAYVGGAK